MSKLPMGEFLSVLRKSKGYTQQEVADILGVSNKTVSSWECGGSCPDISMLPAIAELYGVTCDELLRGERIHAGEPEKISRERLEKSLALRHGERGVVDLRRACRLCNYFNARSRRRGVSEPVGLSSRYRRAHRLRRMYRRRV